MIFLSCINNLLFVGVRLYNCEGGNNGSEYLPTYEDKDGDWMLVGDVPWGLVFNKINITQY